MDSAPRFEIIAVGAVDAIRLPPPAWVRVRRRLQVAWAHPPHGNAPRAEFRNGGSQVLEAGFLVTRVDGDDPGAVAASLATLQDVDPDLGEPRRVELTLGDLAHRGLLTALTLRFGPFDGQARPAWVRVRVRVAAALEGE